MGGDVGANIRKNGVVSEKATTGLLRRKRQFKAKGQNLRERENIKLHQNAEY